jgi:ketosteroid isomerase-like protein
MTLRLTIVRLGLGLSPAFLAGQGAKVDLKAEEGTIRALIEKGSNSRLPFTEDGIFWSGAYKRPTVGSQRAERFPEDSQEKRKNQKGSTKLERLEVAASGDVAWEFSYGTLEFDVDETPSRHVSFETATLRVWKKMDGQWKVAAVFARPLDVPFAPIGSRP